jgi:hypothetical protein
MMAFSFFIAATLVGCAPAKSMQPVASMQNLANPASKNCAKQGGKLAILKRGDGAEYGVCVFADNMQCEEWAMFRGDCPVGGVKVSDYLTQSAQYCIITGGKYQIAGSNKTNQEQGTCSFKNGNACDVWEYLTGKCNPDAEAGQSSYSNPWHVGGRV